MKRLFRGGTVVSGDGLKKMDVLVKGEKILAMGEDLEFKDAEIVDVTGNSLTRIPTWIWRCRVP